MLLKIEYQGQGLVSDVNGFWARGLSRQQCQEETGIDMSVIIDLYNQYDEDFETWCEANY